MTAPLVPLAAWFTGGIWLGLQVPPPGWILGAGVALAALIVEAARRDRLAAATAGVLFLVGLAGWARVGLPDPFPATTGLRPGLVRVEGIVSSDPEREGPQTRLPLLVQGVAAETGSKPASGQLLLHLYGPVPPVRPGDRVRVTVQLSAPQPFRNPGQRPFGPGGSRGGPRLLAIGRADSVERLPDGSVPWWLRVRLWVHRVVQAELPPVSGALFEGLLIGERRQLPPTLLADFRAAGVFHILAISGFNVGLVAGAVFSSCGSSVFPRALRPPWPSPPSPPSPSSLAPSLRCCGPP